MGNQAPRRYVQVAAEAAHAPEGQTTWPAMHPQTPELHVCVAPQAWLQLPQFAVSWTRSAQPPLQGDVPSAQAHCPAMHW